MYGCAPSACVGLAAASAVHQLSVMHSIAAAAVFGAIPLPF